MLAEAERSFVRSCALALDSPMLELVASLQLHLLGLVGTMRDCIDRWACGEPNNTAMMHEQLTIVSQSEVPLRGRDGKLAAISRVRYTAHANIGIRAEAMVAAVLDGGDTSTSQAASGERTAPKQRKKSAGRPQGSNLEADQRLYADWKASGMTRKEFERERILDSGTLRKVQGRIYRRRNKATD